MQSKTLPLFLPIALGELLEEEGGLQLSQPLIYLKSLQSWKMYRRLVSLNPHLLEKMLLSKQASVRSPCVHTLEVEYTHANQPLV